MEISHPASLGILCITESPGTRQDAGLGASYGPPRTRFARKDLEGTGQMAAVFFALSR